MITEAVLVRSVIVLIVLVLVLYQFGYSDRFPYIGKHEWRKRPGYREVLQILMHRVERYSGCAPLPVESIDRIESTVDLVLAALLKNHTSIKIELPNFDCGTHKVDISLEITKEEVAMTFVDDN